MTVRHVLEWLSHQSPERLVHLSSLVASREAYDRPAVTLLVGTSAVDAIQEILKSLRLPHEGYKGGTYFYTLDSWALFNPKYGRCGCELTEEVLEGISAIGDFLGEFTRAARIEQREVTPLRNERGGR